jgi:hypothetical protein
MSKLKVGQVRRWLRPTFKGSANFVVLFINKYTAALKYPDDFTTEAAIYNVEQHSEIDPDWLAQQEVEKWLNS